MAARSPLKIETPFYGCLPGKGNNMFKSEIYFKCPFLNAASSKKIKSTFTSKSTTRKTGKDDMSGG